MTAIEFYPLANLFPLIEGTDFDALVDDISRNGLHEPITLYQDKILDGRNRYRSCLAALVEPEFEEYEGNDPIGYVISKNLTRRHLNDAQRAMVAAKLATLKHGGDRSKSPIGDLNQQQAADLLNVSKRTVERAVEVRDHGTPELQRAVELGGLSISAAADIASLPQPKQTEIVARGRREILEEARKIRAAETEKRHAERIAKLAAISAGNSPLPQDRRYPVILADPPWQYRSGTEFPTRDVANHYPTMALEEICALPVSGLATGDAVLFLWVPSPKLAEATQIIAAWGFEYQTSVVWVKDKIGMGHYVRSQHELLLIASRGKMPHPLPKDRPSSVIEAPRREHSRKPDEAYELIERMYPSLPKIELFARQQREGWDGETKHQSCRRPEGSRVRNGSDGRYTYWSVASRQRRDPAVLETLPPPSDGPPSHWQARRYVLELGANELSESKSNSGKRSEGLGFSGISGEAIQDYNRVPTPLPPFMLLVSCALLIKKAKAHEAFTTLWPLSMTAYLAFEFINAHCAGSCVCPSNSGDVVCLLLGAPPAGDRT